MTKPEFKNSYIILFLLLVLLEPLAGSNREVRVVKYDDKIDLEQLEEYLIAVSNVSIINSETREHTYLGNTQEGKITVPEDYEKGIILMYELQGVDYRYYLPPFTNDALIGISSSQEFDCVKYVRYNNCHAITELPESQFGSDCDLYTYILLDYCRNSPIMISPGQMVNTVYQDYTDYMQKRCTQQSPVIRT